MYIGRSPNRNLKEISYSPYSRSGSPINKMPSLPEFEQNSVRNRNKDTTIINKILLNQNLERLKDKNEKSNNDNTSNYGSRSQKSVSKNNYNNGSSTGNKYTGILPIIKNKSNRSFKMQDPKNNHFNFSYQSYKKSNTIKLQPNKYFISPLQSPKSSSSKNLHNIIYSNKNYTQYKSYSKNNASRNIKYHEHSPIKNILYPRSNSRR